jgi:adenosylcobyric acid synthase
MSNNSGVTPEGIEMGRAQIVQAEASKIPPHVDMNPVLLKPTSDIGSQVVVFGKATANRTALEYHKYKQQLFPSICKALDRLRDNYDLVVIEGAGSCAEVNLMADDIVNFSIAEYANASVILVADIHKGGVFAQIIGTLACLNSRQQDLIKGFIINRFRGDASIFQDGIDWIENKTGKPVFGVLPHYTDIHIESEDSVVIENPPKVTVFPKNQTAICVIRIPHISNFTDFSPLSSIPGLNLHFVEKVQSVSNFKAVIIPGSKNTRFDLDWLNNSGWAEELKAYAARGGSILGICGGYQMMGIYVDDPDGIEGTPGKTPGLSLLPVETILKAPKTTTLTRFSWGKETGIGYEIHMGITKRTAGSPMLHVFEQNHVPCSKENGCIAENTPNIAGTYIHGIFDNPGITKRWFQTIGLEDVKVSYPHAFETKNIEYDKLADHFAKHIHTQKICDLIN